MLDPLRYSRKKKNKNKNKETTPLTTEYNPKNKNWPVETLMGTLHDMPDGEGVACVLHPEEDEVENGGLLQLPHLPHHKAQRLLN